MNIEKGALINLRAVIDYYHKHYSVLYVTSNNHKSDYMSMRFISLN